MKIYNVRQKYHNLSISKKIIIPLLLLLFIFILIFTYLLIFLTSNRQQIENKTATFQKINDLSDQINFLRQETEKSILSYRFTKQYRYLDVMSTNQREVTKIIDVIKPLITAPPDRELLDIFINSREGLLKTRNDLVQAIQQNNDNDILRYFTAWEIQSENSYAALMDFTNYNLRLLEINENIYRSIITNIFVFALVLISLFSLLIVIFYYYLRHVVTNPIRELSRIAEKISEGNFNIKFKYYGEDEIGKLSENLSQMSKYLKAYYEFLHDEVKKKEQEIAKNKEFEALKDNFLNIASHELKTPITSLKAYSHILEMITERNNHLEYKPYLSKIDNQILRLTNLITSLLDVTRIHANKMPFTMKYFDLNSLIKNITENYEASESDHEIIVQGKAIRKIYGDEDRVSQVVDNLVSNAVKYSPGKDRVTVQITNDKKSVKVSVEDSGIGIEKKYQKKIFSRFFRVAGIDESTYPGLGIGLYVCSGIVKRHHGKIWVESEKGKGSTFIFTLPYKAESTG